MLAELRLGNSSGATPFYERQLQVLKARNDEHMAKVEFIVDSVKSNQKLESDFLEVAVRLLGEGKNGDNPAQAVSALMKIQFNVTEVVVMLKSDEMETGVCHARYDAACQRVMHKGTVCDDRLSNALRKSLFDQENTSVRSCAFVPLLFDDALLGVMILGSDSGSRFQPGVGVMFLDRLGRLIGGYIHGRLSQP